MCNFGGKAGLALVQSVTAISVSIRVRGKPGVQPLIHHAVQQQINNSFLPGLDVKRAMLAVEIVVKRQCGTEFETLLPERAVQIVEIAKSPGSKVIERIPVSRNGQRLAPVKQRLG